MSCFKMLTTMPTHHKTLALSAALGVSRRGTVGLLVDLWCWSVTNAAEDGTIKNASAVTIATALDYPRKKADQLLSALVECGFIDETDAGGYRIHDWPQYRVDENADREAARLRKAQERHKKRDMSQNVTPEVTQNSVTCHTEKRDMSQPKETEKETKREKNQKRETEKEIEKETDKNTPRARACADVRAYAREDTRTSAAVELGIKVNAEVLREELDALMPNDSECLPDDTLIELCRLAPCLDVRMIRELARLAQIARPGSLYSYLKKILTDWDANGVSDIRRFKKYLQERQI